TDTQRVILSSAARREDGAVLPVPKSLKIKGGALKAMLDGLRKRGLLAERPAAPDAIAWREDADGRRLMLVLAQAGLGAIGDEVDEPQKPLATAEPGSKRPRRRGGARTKVRSRPAGETAPAPRKGSKQALLLDLLKRKSGASLEEIVAVTGWQAHSV